MIFNEDTSAGFFCSFLTEKQQWADISGVKGQLRVADFVHPLSEAEPGFELNRSEEQVKSLDGSVLPQDARMFRNFAAQVQSGKLNRDWPMWALKTQQVMDACFASARSGGALVRVSG
ncbi:MAG: hypothetical protein H7Y43_05855 [Akkermansiaceae bacterium]|nr:hypothetical protein [Verrucomicrobiales bacterium]